MGNATNSFSLSKARLIFYSKNRQKFRRVASVDSHHSPGVLATFHKAPGHEARMSEQAFVDAVRNGNLAELQRLVGDGISVNAEVSPNNTLLVRASEEGHLEMVRWLLDHGAR